VNLIDNIKFKYWNPVDVAKEKIITWKPGSLKSEKDYEKSLYNYLHKNLDKLQVTKQYAKGRIKADIVIQDKVIIELKNNLNSTAKYQRLIGQLIEYKNWEGNVIILLTGGTDLNLKKDLQKFIDEQNGLWEEQNFTLIVKE